MRDGAVRRSLKATARALFWLNVTLDRRLRRLRGERPHLLAGACQRCARCCEAPGGSRHRRGLASAHAADARSSGGKSTSTDSSWPKSVASSRLFVFHCTHFDWATRSCDSYDSRPGMCRDYPRALLFQPLPEMLARLRVSGAATQRRRAAPGPGGPGPRPGAARTAEEGPPPRAVILRGLARARTTRLAYNSRRLPKGAPNNLGEPRAAARGLAKNSRRLPKGAPNMGECAREESKCKTWASRDGRS